MQIGKRTMESMCWQLSVHSRPPQGPGGRQEVGGGYILTAPPAPGEGRKAPQAKPDTPKNQQRGGKGREGPPERTSSRAAKTKSREGRPKEPAAGRQNKIIFFFFAGRQTSFTPPDFSLIYFKIMKPSPANLKLSPAECCKRNTQP